MTVAGIETSAVATLPRSPVRVASMTSCTAAPRAAGAWISGPSRPPTMTRAFDGWSPPKPWLSVLSTLTAFCSGLAAITPSGPSLSIALTRPCSG